MKKVLVFLACLFFAVSCYAQTTTVSGTVIDSDSTTWTNGTITVQFIPNPSQPNLSLYNINGVPLSPSVINQGPISLGGSGTFSLSVYQSAAVSPSGSTWQYTICPNASSKCGVFTIQAVGTTQNLTSSITALIPAPRFLAVIGSYGYNNTEAQVSQVPGSLYYNVISSCYEVWSGSSFGCMSTGAGIYLPLAGGTLATNAAIAFAGTGAATTLNNLAPGVSSTGTGGLAGNPGSGQTWSITPSGNANFYSTNAVVSPCQYAGATADVQINSALSAISSGGTIDARCYGNSTIYIASQVHVAPGGNTGPSQTLLFDPATNVLPFTNTVNMFLKGPNGTIKGLHTVLPPSAAYTGQEITINENTIEGATGGLEDIQIDARSETTWGQAGGYGIYISSANSSFGIAFLPIKHIRIWGLYRGLYLTAATNGWINDISPFDIVISGSAAGIELNATGTASLGNSVESTTFVNYTYENPAGFSGVGILYSGSSMVSNFFVGGGASIDGSGSTLSNTNSFAGSSFAYSYFSPSWAILNNISVPAGTATNGTALTEIQTNFSLPASGGTTSGENLTGYGFGWSNAGGSFYQQGAAFGSYLNSFNTAGFKWYCMVGSNNSTLCATLNPSGNLTITGALSASNIGVDGSGNAVVSLATGSASLVGSNVTMTSAATFYDGPSISSLEAGTWLLQGTVSLQTTSTASAVNFTCRLWDGTTVVTSTQKTLGALSSAAVRNESMSLSGLFTEGSIFTPKISCTSDNASQLMLYLTTYTSNPGASSLSAVRVR